MENIKVEALRIQLGLSQEEFVNSINIKLKEINKKAICLSIRTYQNRLSGRTPWKLEEATAISLIGGLPVSQIKF